MLTDLGDRSRYADFWDALRAEGRLVADRSAAMLRWRLSDPDLTVRPLLLSFNRDRTITGYALVLLGKGSPIEPPVLEIIDLAALKSETAAIPALMRTLIGNARAMGAAKVRMQTVSTVMLEKLGAFAANARHEGGWGHCHVNFDPEANETVRSGWSPTPFDGDYSFCTRPVPN